MRDLMILTPLCYGGYRYSPVGGFLSDRIEAVKRRFKPDEAERKLFYALAADVLADPDFIAAGRHLQHGTTSVYEHSVHVAFTAFCMAVRLRRPVRLQELVRGALLHDYFGYDWHEKGGGHRLHGFFHPKRACRRAEKKYALTRVERGIILRHMWPLTLLPPCTREAWIVTAADKLCALDETLGRFLAAAGIESRWRALARV